MMLKKLWEIFQTSSLFLILAAVCVLTLSSTAGKC